MALIATSFSTVRLTSHYLFVITIRTTSLLFFVRVFVAVFNYFSLLQSLHFLWLVGQLCSLFFRSSVTVIIFFISGLRSSHRRCSVKKAFLEISQNSQENTCARASFLIKLQVAPATLLKKKLWDRCFPVNYAKFLRTSFFYRTPPVAASDDFWWFLVFYLAELNLPLKFMNDSVPSLLKNKITPSQLT